MLILAGACSVAFVLIHLFIGKLAFLDVLPRSRWLSFSGGVAVAYVFLHILPELSSHQQTFARGLRVGDNAAEAWVYLVALSGLAFFYGLERAAKASRRSSAKDRVESEVLWMHIVSFGVYNVLIGYLLLQRPRPTPRSRQRRSDGAKNRRRGIRRERAPRFWPWPVAFTSGGAAVPTAGRERGPISGAQGSRRSDGAARIVCTASAKRAVAVSWRSAEPQSRSRGPSSRPVYDSPA